VASLCRRNATADASFSDRSVATAAALSDRDFSRFFSSCACFGVSLRYLRSSDSRESCRGRTSGWS
jgi:hypothetical protein